MRPVHIVSAAGIVLLAAASNAQQPMQTLEVVGTTPLGAELDADKIAASVQSASADDLRAQRTISFAEFMNRNFGSVFVNEAQGNPLQPDVQYRGYVGSPLLGLPQGIAVYQDGVRVNEPFGDTVNWALIPDSAIDTVYLMPGSNPLFGLNALGGAIAISTKNGFTHPGTSAEVHTGSFSRAGLEFETGGSTSDQLSYFVTATYLEEDGWRDFSPTEATQLFANLGWQSDRSSIDISLNHADTDLIGNGPAPVELLEQSRNAVFTRPDRTENELTLLNLSGSHSVSSVLTLTGNFYVRGSDVSTLNGDDADFEECEDTVGFLCLEDDGTEELVFDGNGDAIPAGAAVEGAAVNRTDTEQDGAGFGIQASWSGALADRENFFTVGLAYDQGDIAFAADSELAAFDTTRFAVPGGVFVGDAFTRLNADISNVGLYISNIFILTDALSLSLSGRYNKTEITLRDQLGTALDGDHEFDRFNPAIGLTYALSDGLIIYAGYTEANRAPSPVELTCADEDDPCRLPNAFLADPPLEDVVAKTFETGFRGTHGGTRWHAGIFRTTNEDDILFISAGALTTEGFFDNVGRTRRDGIELGIDGVVADKLTWFANYTYLDASFRHSFAVASPNHPFAVGGQIQVEPGDRLALIPDRFLKAGLTLTPTERLSFGINAMITSGVYFRGDEGNFADKVDAYAIVNARAEYAVNDKIQLFLNVDNLFDANYETFGLFGEADEVLGDEFGDNRFLSPGAPRAAWIGLRAQF